jgi:hypothetical protein
VANSTPPASELDQKGVRRLDLGAALGLVGALVAIVIPISFVLLATYNPGGFFKFVGQLVEVTSLLVLAGAILLLLSLFVYRRSFAALRKVDDRFLLASILCIIGTIGFLLLVVAGAVAAGNSSSIVACTQGKPSQILSCLKSGQPLGAYTAIAGFEFVLVGIFGLILGLWSAGSRFHRRGYTAGAGLYGILLLVAIGPFIALLTPVPGIEYVVFLLPAVAVAAPALVLLASRSLFDLA